MAAAPKYLQSGVARPTPAPAGGTLITTPQPEYSLSGIRGLLNPGETVAMHPNVATTPEPLLESVLNFSG